jgi:alkanesulfonate monooxygenase SsuD/methylene tetrahydromethanopterin reductase-like flavin-dependent oxidoreductase (luciferase family)
VRFAQTLERGRFDEHPDWTSTGRCTKIPESNANKSGRQRVIDRARRDYLTVRQLARIAGSYGGLAMVSAPAMIAGQMEESFFGNAYDGFNIIFPFVPGALDDSVGRGMLHRSTQAPPPLQAASAGSRGPCG